MFPSENSSQLSTTPLKIDQATAMKGECFFCAAIAKENIVSGSIERLVSIKDPLDY